ncbi:hypothetical protein QVD17_31705 [Tagetes erecta]|uniref:Uncharacterized protein n=1 Tax=Tagetes erecta TaxID=13708 RepID=A0AAD8K8A1_TARER|nr:hypothetical protein QVD17_31705 [Tagetes erecta]
MKLNTKKSELMEETVCKTKFDRSRYEKSKKLKIDIGYAETRKNGWGCVILDEIKEAKTLVLKGVRIRK